MAERVNKLILETEFKTTGDVTQSVSKVDQLQVAAKEAQTDIIKLTEAEKKLEQAANNAGVAVESESKKVSEFAKNVKGAGAAMNELAKINQLKDAFKLAGITKTTADIKKFKDEIKNSGGDIDKATAALERFTAELPAELRTKLFDEMQAELKEIDQNLISPVARLRQLKREINTTEDPVLLKELIKEAALLQDQIVDTNTAIKSLSSDTFVTDALVESAQTAVGAFTAFQGVLSLTADSEKEYAEAAAKAQGALALLTGVQSVMNALQKESRVSLLAQVAAQKLHAFFIDQTTGKLRLLRLALAATVIGAVVFAVIALARNWEAVSRALGLANEKQQLNNEITKRAIENYGAEAASIEVAKAKLKDSNTTQDERRQIIQDLQEQYPSYLKNINAETSSYEDIDAALKNVNEALFLKFKIQAAEEILTEKLRKQLELTTQQQREFNEELSFGEKLLDGLQEGLGFGTETDELREVNKDIRNIIDSITDFSSELSDLGGDPTSDAGAGIKKATKEVDKVLDGSIQQLQNKVEALRKIVTEGTVFGSDAFEVALGRYKLAVQELADANERLNIKETVDEAEQFAEGSLNALRKKVQDLQEILNDTTASTPEFFAAADAVKAAQKALDEVEASIADNKVEAKKSNLAAILSEQERHELAMAQVVGKSEKEQLAIQLEFAKKKLDLARASGDASEEELLNLQNVITELQAQLNKAGDALTFKDKIKALLPEIQTLVNTAISAVQTFVSIAQAANDKLIGLQEARVQQVLEIADRGNVALLELEQERLDGLNRQREKFVRTQQRLAQIQLVAESLIAIAKSAAQGGAAAPFTIAATLIALAAGLAQARATANAQSFKKGGVYSSRGGYTGYGPPSGQSLQLGEKPYDYHYKEHIMPDGVTSIGQNLQWLEQIRMKKLDIGKMMSDKKQTVVMAGNDNRELVEAIKRIPGVSINFKKNGIIDLIYETEYQRKRLKSKLS